MAKTQTSRGAKRTRRGRGTSTRRKAQVKRVSKNPVKPPPGGGLSARGLTKYVETKSVEGVAGSLFMDVTSASATKPQSTTILIPPAWGGGLTRGTGDSGEFIGSSVYDRYLNMKCVIDFSHLLPVGAGTGHATSPIENVHYIMGFCKNTLRDVPETVVKSSDYDQSIGAAMVVDNVGSHFLSYSQKWMNFKILKRGKLMPRNSNKNFNPSQQDGLEGIVQGTEGPQSIQMKFNWTLKRKAKLVADTANAGKFIRQDSWIPFVAFYSASLHGQNADKVPHINLVSKLWYSDS
jgi:hypothetical protein